MAAALLTALTGTINVHLRQPATLAVILPVDLVTTASMAVKLGLDRYKWPYKWGYKQGL